MNKKCETCIRNKTMYCPNSMKCMTIDDKPYYQNIIMLLEENKKQKEVIDKAIKYIQQNIYSYYDSKGEKYTEETVFERKANPKKLLDILNEVSNEYRNY